VNESVSGRKRYLSFNYCWPDEFAETVVVAAASAGTAAGTAVVVDYYQLHLLSNHVLDLTVVSIVFLVMSYK
jgi:hypothetical protein